MARFRHPEKTVRETFVDPDSGESVENSVRVRGLTRSEVATLATMKDNKEAVPLFVIRSALVGEYSDEDIDNMPPGLFAAAVAAVLELSGMGDADAPEKKTS